MCWLMHHGYKIPEDVSVLSFDGIPYTEKLNPSMTTICQPVEFQAERKNKWNVISAGWKRAKK